MLQNVSETTSMLKNETKLPMDETAAERSFENVCSVQNFKTNFSLSESKNFLLSLGQKSRRELLSDRLNMSKLIKKYD